MIFCLDREGDVCYDLLYPAFHYESNRILVTTSFSSTLSPGLTGSGIPGGGRSVEYGMSFDRIKILLVDDSAVMRRIVASFLVKMGCVQVEEASGVSQAMHSIDIERPDLIICDYAMPGQTGLDLLKRIRRDPRNSKVIFIMITAEAQLCQILSAFREGADQYVTKPFTREYLRYILERALEDF